MTARFNLLYNKAFDENGNIKACGREVCQELILICNQIEKNVSHGNAETGMMEVEAIKKLKEKLS